MTNLFDCAFDSLFIKEPYTFSGLLRNHLSPLTKKKRYWKKKTIWIYEGAPSLPGTLKVNSNTIFVYQEEEKKLTQFMGLSLFYHALENKCLEGWKV